MARSSPAGLTAQHYNWMASRIAHEFHHSTSGQGERDLLMQLAERLADDMARTNPRFDAVRFLSACKDFD